MLFMALALTLLAAPAPGPSARLLANGELLTPADVAVLDRDLRITQANIVELKPHMPPGFAIGMALGFSFSVLLLPGIPLMIFGASASLVNTAALLVAGGVLTALGGVALLVAAICAVLGNNAESDMADERARLVEHRDALGKRLAPHRLEPRPQPSPTPSYVPGVQLDVPAIHLVTLARF